MRTCIINRFWTSRMAPGLSLPRTGEARSAIIGCAVLCTGKICGTSHFDLD